MKRLIPNILSVARVAGAAALLACGYPSAAFLAVFALCGASDVFDGFLARKLSAESVFGANIDTIADLALVVVCCIKILPSLALPFWVLLWAVCIALVKCAAFIVAFAKGKVESLHSIANKALGALLFASVFLLAIIDPLCISIALCAFAMLVAVVDIYLICEKR